MSVAIVGNNPYLNNLSIKFAEIALSISQVETKKGDRIGWQKDGKEVYIYRAGMLRDVWGANGECESEKALDFVVNWLGLYKSGLIHPDEEGIQTIQKIIQVFINFSEMSENRKPSLLKSALGLVREVSNDTKAALNYKTAAVALSKGFNIPLPAPAKSAPQPVVEKLQEDLMSDDFVVVSYEIANK
jgi:hypothetical protein